MNHTVIVRSLQLLTHLLFFYGIWYSFQTDVTTYLIIGLFYAVLINIMLGINIGFHRYLAHKSFKTNKFCHYLMIVAGTLAVMGSPLGWVSVHRQHHRYSDEEGDPHSPNSLGALRTWLGFWGDFKIQETCRDLRKEPIHKFIYQHYGKIHMLYILLLLLINPLLVLYLYALPAVVVFHAAGAFDVLAHLHGYRNFETRDKSRNNWLVALFTMGEGWHNNHHKNPISWNNRVKWWEIDPTSWIIKLIKKEELYDGR